MNSTKTTLFSWSCQWLETTSYAFDSANVFVSPISVKWPQLWEITPPIKHMITCGKTRSRWVCIFPWWVSYINIMPLCWFPSQTIVNFIVLARFYQNKHSLDLCINNVSFNLTSETPIHLYLWYPTIVRVNFYSLSTDSVSFISVLEYLSGIYSELMKERVKKLSTWD